MKINMNNVVKMCIKRNLSPVAIVKTASICRKIDSKVNIDRLLILAYCRM